MRNNILILSRQLVLVSLGNADPKDLADPTRAGCWGETGLLIKQPIATGVDIELFVASPTDLLGYGDMTAAGMLKPTVLPLELAEVMPGRINARLNTDAQSQQLSTAILAAIAAIRNPASAGGLKRKPAKGEQ